MEENVIENEHEANEMPESKFACLGIAECQQVLERLKGGIVIDDELPFAVKALLDEYKYDEKTLRREVGDRKAELELHRKKAVDLHIAKNYAQALEEYDEYFRTLGSQIADQEAENLWEECREYVSLAKKRKWQKISAVVIVLILCGLAVDQVLFRKSVKAFQAALLHRDYENATKTAIKISWRYDTEGGISNLVCFLDERNEFNQLCSKELIQSSLNEYGGIKWQEVQSLVQQADTNEDLSLGIQQLSQAAEMTMKLAKECGVLGAMERDFNAMYESCNQKDADYYVHGDWEILQQLRETEVTQTNLNLIADRYNLMVEITNRVARLMDAQKDMQPVKDRFEQMLKEEQIQVQGMLNYSSSQLSEAQRLAVIALKKEELFEFADARLIYTRAIEHIKASQKNRKEDEKELARIDQARRDFNALYEKLDTGLAQKNCPDDWKALSIQIEKAKAAYDRKDRWKGDAYVCYEAATESLKRIEKKMEDGYRASRFKKEFDRLYAKLDIGLAEKWFPDKWNALFGQKKKADEAYEKGENWETVDVCYEVVSQTLEDLMREICIKARLVFNEKYNGTDDEAKEIMAKSYPDEWENIKGLIQKAKEEYKKPDYWEGDAYKLYIEAEKRLREIHDKAVEKKDLIYFDMSGYEDALRPMSEYTNIPPGTATNRPSQ